MIRVKVDMKPLARALSQMSEQHRNFVLSDALNRALDGAFVVAKRGIGKQANIAIGDIAKTMSKIPATRGRHVAVLQSSSRWFAASYKRFNATQKSKGAAFTPWKGKREMIKGGFIATMKSGHTSIFKRATKRRLPIADVGWGPNPAREMMREDHGSRVPADIREEVAKRFLARFAYQYDRMVKAAKSSNGL